jgi:hypothetical protein
MPTDPATIAYSALPDKLGTGCMLPVFHARVDDAGRTTIEAYLPHRCPVAQQEHVREHFLRHGLHGVEIVLVTDIPPDQLWEGNTWEGQDAS